MATREEVKLAAHQLGTLLIESNANFYDVAEALAEGYAAESAKYESLPLITVLSKIAALNELQSVSNNTIKDYVADARAGFASWTQIGDALDVTKQAAQQRYGKDDTPSK